MILIFLNFLDMAMIYITRSYEIIFNYF